MLPKGRIVFEEFADKLRFPEKTLPHIIDSVWRIKRNSVFFNKFLGEEFHQ